MEENNVVDNRTENEVKIEYKTPNFRYLVVEYCFTDDSYSGDKHILGSYDTLGKARYEAGKYIRDNKKELMRKYRSWNVQVQKDRIYFSNI